MGHFEPILEPNFERPDNIGASRPWLVSLVVHLCLLIVLSLLTTSVSKPVVRLLIQSAMQDAIEIPEKPPAAFQVQLLPSQKVGASSLEDDEAARSMAPQLGDPTDVPSLDVPQFESPQYQFIPPLEPIQGLELDTNQAIKGSAGFGVTGAEGAVDHITKEILTSLEERHTLVVWFFDQSASLIRQRETIRNRFDRIYKELGVIKESGSSRFRKRNDEEPLLTSIVAFGKDVSFPTKKPTADYGEIRKAVENIEKDDSGDEYVFTAIQEAIIRHKKYRRRSVTGDPDRNVMFVVFTDEAGDDQDLLDATTRQCTNLAIPVYVVGIPAPFGQKETIVKWVDPDKNFDQTPRRGRVTQGPESLYPECIRLGFANYRQNASLDSGFGPFALTRLARETGGHYFPVHPNRDSSKPLRWKDVADYSSHLSVFFDPNVMRHYRPDYVSAADYQRRIGESKTRSALVEAATQSEIMPMSQPRTRFVKRDEAALSNELSEAQKQAASLEPELNRLLAILKDGERDRSNEAVPRWQAGYDLAMGRVLAVKARTEGYNLMLAEAKRGKKFSNEENNTWVLDPSKEVTAGSQVANAANKAEEYLNRVVTEHEGTPWAYLAMAELKQPLGWQWRETHTDLNPPRQNANPANNNNNIPQAQDEQRRMLERRPERRPVPKL
ncbi:MAG: VWA domain-containing protein [Planctomycetales bacterium]|nr:VWA domain-containing protein [Planctomycetales bacterium]